MTPHELLTQSVGAIRSGRLNNLSPLIGLFMDPNTGKSMSMQDREPMIPLLNVRMPRRTTIMCGRQVSKSYTMTMSDILLSGMVKGINSLIVQPRGDQKNRYNAQILAPLLRNCTVRDEIIDFKGNQSVELKRMRNGNFIMLGCSYTSPDAIRGASGVGLVIVDECQDINPEFLPVIEAVTNASIDHGYLIRMGTAKTTGDALSSSFGDSCQFHWCTKCDHCNKYTIAAPQEQLLKMISDVRGIIGPVCGHCGKPINTRNGFFVPAYPSRIDEHSGYHVPAIVLPFHHAPHKWRDILNARRGNPRTFANEFLGIPDDTAVRILSLKDLLNARNGLDGSMQAGANVRDQYDLVATAVDWTGGGNGESTTVVAIVGRQISTGKTDVLYIERLQRGMDAGEEADRVAYISEYFRSDFVAHDYTGAGNLREYTLITRHPQWLTRTFPITYVYRPNAELVTESVSTGTRASYVVDKTKSLALTMMMLKAGLITLPQFRAEDVQAPQQDFLALIEQHQTTLRGSDIFLFAKIAKKPDDGAHAVNIANIALCHLSGYPMAAPIDRYNMSTQVYEDLGIQH